ncbi:ABC transporter, phosphonate, periplasmic substrate-binding protein [Pseudobythopirellula maris]|uniref:ABC transporter, phosphonate, periplasmic substrate-binding protein n=1 Tax=Pseudobythopirellula maris TaxID=2527991 RepID=A0A5C5ZPM1_9BACT|nr:phosphate/phosphite/phosphonate ABC transporter substrate-binding protein [Pseudobythopirellula maris]TWT88837.1 ABC transporter, phosphonate, periplasmic substrate-binding protein [Pseudobythopirellula maris]
MSADPGAFSFGRLLKILLPVLLLAVGIRFTLPGYERAAQKEMEDNMLARLMGEAVQLPEETVPFSDADHDLVNDPPAEPADGEAAAAPERLVFSYIASPEPEDAAEVWADVTTAISEATGLPVEYAHYETTGEQFAAMARDEVHVIGVNTGAVPTAVANVGFTPVCTFGDAAGEYGYRMKLIVSKDSKAEGLGDLRGKKIAFTRPDSNSGFKAAMVQLMNDEGMLPERDYQWGFTYDHVTSIHAVAAGEEAAAPVASDILDRLTTSGEVSTDDFKVIYDSERFPPATIGYAHNLPAATRDAIREALLSFAWEGSSVAAKYADSGAAQFVAVNYKDDWDNIRRIDEAIRRVRAQHSAAAE